MMHQPVNPTLRLNDRPKRDRVIEKDEIISLIIDMEVLDPQKLYEKYFVEK